MDKPLVKKIVNDKEFKNLDSINTFYSSLALKIHLSTNYNFGRKNVVEYKDLNEWVI